MPAHLVHMEKLHIAHSGKEGKQMIAAGGWLLLWAVWPVTSAHLEAKARIRKLEELRLDQGTWLSIFC